MMLRDFKIFYIYINSHVRISIQAKDNQNKNENIITLPWWLSDTNNNKIFKNIYCKKYAHKTINKFKEQLGELGG
jgi:hypothetical protein